MSKKIQTQPDRFKQAARDLGCDDDEARFAEVVRKIASAPPSPKGEPKTKPKTPSK